MSEKDKKEVGYGRLHCRLSLEDKDLLDKLQKKTGLSRTKIIANALKIYTHLLKKQEN